MARPIVWQLRRARSLPEAGGKTLYFVTEGGSRRSPAKFFRPDEVPEFEGEIAWFEIEKPRGERRRVVRRVNPNGTPYEA